jgi:hypothetical protein
MVPIKPLRASSILIGLILVGGICGWSIPEFYDWTGADQSRPAPLMWQVPLGVSLVGLFLCVSLPWIPVTGWAEELPQRSLQFQLKTLLIVTGAVAVAIATGTQFPVAVANACVVLALLAALWLTLHQRQWRLPIVALLTCLFMPFIWLLGYEELTNIRSILPMAAGLPNLLPAAFMGYLLGWNLHEGGWVSIVITAIQITVGLGLIRLGTKRTVAFLLVSLLSSLMSSLILNALVRA